jgi:hypothetical protein
MENISFNDLPPSNAVKSELKTLKFIPCFNSNAVDVSMEKYH